MKKRNLPLYYFLFWVILYAALVIIIPTDKATLEQYNLSPLFAKLLSVTVVLPIIAIWSMAFYGYSKLKSYSKLITNHKDGKAISIIATGLQVLALGLPTASAINTFGNIIARANSDYAQAHGVISIYINLVVPLAAFLVIGIGARNLVYQIKPKSSHLLTYTILFLLAAISVFYTHAVTEHGGINQTFHIPMLILITTVVIPYVTIWYIGIFASIDLFVYSQKVKGIIYKNCWRYVSGGIAMIIVSMITLQYLTTLTNRLTKLPIGSLMLIIYLLLILMAVGYVLVAKGAKGLRKIEEV